MISYVIFNKKQVQVVLIIYTSQSVEDPRGVRQSIIWQNLCRKLHEKERNWTAKGQSASLSPHWIRQWLSTVL